jgi:H+-transporting ATPase
VIDLLIASTLANRGIAMASLPLVVVGGTFAAAVVFAFLVDIAKVPVFHRLGIV